MPQTPAPKHSLFERVQIGAIAGFIAAWISPELPDVLRLTTPAIFAVVTLLLFSILLPTLTWLFHGQADRKRVLVGRVLLCIGGWIALWAVLGALRNVTFAKSLHDAVYSDNLAVTLMAALGLTSLSITVLKQLLPLAISASRIASASRQTR
ncbi:hypothetical protein JCM19000A_16390 [Silvimonas sp. JCM 19000]